MTIHPDRVVPTTAATPWYRRTLRWGQTNLVEIDPARYDDAWWRGYWRRTRVQGLIINAGGIVAYYPSEFPLHHRAVALGDGDLYGAVAASARDEGLAVVARMDSNRVAEDFYRAHPDWICVAADGEPYRAGEKFVTCINSPYYWDYLPQVLTEIVRRSRPDGFADNSWAGIPRSKICHCRHCAKLFEEWSGLPLPPRTDWDNETYRRWVAWSYQRRTDLWELNNRVTTAEGGSDCRWMGMLSGDVINNSERCIDLPAILDRSEIIMLDHQHRNAADGFQQNTEVGKRLHELVGWQKLIPESTPQYQLGVPAFRVAAMPPAEVRLWASAGFAGGIQPWWHHIGSCHDDRRQYRTAEPIFRWHEANEDVLLDRVPEADVAVVWSQTNHDLVGRERVRERTLGPYRGVVKALDRAGIDYVPVHADRLEAAADRFGVLVLPNLGAMSDDQAAAVHRFVADGGSVVASGRTGSYDEHGALRHRPALSDLFGVRPTGAERGSEVATDTDIETFASHSYLRLTPELRAAVDGPTDPDAPAPGGTRHALLAGLDETDLVAFGGHLIDVEVDQDADVLATYVPAFPIYPPETSWMREPRTGHAAVVARMNPAGGRLVWLAADLDRCYARDEQVDHATLVAGAVRWAVGDRPRLVVEAADVDVTEVLVSASLYRTPEHVVLHLTNTVTSSPVPGRQGTLVPVGPFRIRIRDDLLAPGTTAAALRVAGRTVPVSAADGYLDVQVDRVVDHEVVVLAR